MNYYPHHIGDFNNATRHLTRVERSLYRDAIDLYYDTEQPLPGDDFDYLAKRLLASSDEEKSALRDVLNEFFTLDGGAYHHSRCDAEIAKYRANAESKSKAGRASAAKRKQKSTPVERMNNGCATNQEPRTKNQEPLKAESNPAPAKPARFDPVAMPLPDCLHRTDWTAWISYRRARKLTTAEPTMLKQLQFLTECNARGQPPDVIINASITNGWQGLFEPKTGGRRNGNGVAGTIAELTGANRFPGRDAGIIDGEARRVD
jgi:uncharacterized protein YdaU (DUF1376 family)